MPRASQRNDRPRAALAVHHERRVALCVAGLLFSVYLFTFSGVYHSSDEMSMLAATGSLARRGAWDIDLLRWMGEQQGSFGPDGHLYSRKGIGTTLAALPLYWLAVQWNDLGNVQAAMLTNGLVTALTGAVIYRFLRRLRYGPGPALFAALGFGLGTMAWPYARYLFSESLAGLGLMTCAYGLLRLGDRRPSAAVPEQGRSDAASLLLAGVGLGVALLARLNNAIVAPFLGLLLLATLYRLHGRRWPAWIGRVALFGLPVLLALAVAAWYNWLRFGSPLTTGYLPEERFATPFFEGLYGLLLSPGKGLVWYNPLLFAALLAWPRFLRQHRTEALLALAVVLANVAFYAPWYLWWAGHGWGPRFLVAVLPFAALPLAPALQVAACGLQAARRRALAAGLIVLALLSLAVQVLGVAVNFNLYLEDVHAALGLYHPATLFDPAYSPLLRQWAYLRPASLDLAWMRGGSVSWSLLLVGLTVVLVSVLALGEILRGRRTPWAGGGLAVLLALMALRLLLHAGPAGDVAQAARELERLERPGEVALVAEPAWTETFQDAYDGHLPLWGVSDPGQLPAPYPGVWQAGGELPAGAALRFQVGAAGLALYGPERRLPARLENRADRLGGNVELVAADVPDSSAWRGESCAVTLYWRALSPADRSYTVFVQLLAADGEAGTKAGQVDRPPCGGGCPTTTWQPGALFGERYEVAIRGDAPSGRYRLVAGLYDLATGERLPLVDAQGNVQGDAILLDWITVR